ncbi:hypothetical protein [Methylophaga sp. UBA2689]|jgi:hypothetical protein|uniref:hypothetical protein n=1 Tax=Methylophaga sp. UBA2689 TaxID=1946878 RepID=UPI0025DCA371|nr:hypothetical protein [Methylophaga sp. UBA2689]|tara:strand:- start:2941 stop:3243 length:303 start_codon:yes stop_codon:yes gene_type:complete
MKINLNKPEDFNKKNLAKLIASKDDSQHRQLRVTQLGELYLSDEVGNINIENISFRLETLCAGNNYVGQYAASDEAWIEALYTVIAQNWPSPKSTYIDMF